MDFSVRVICMVFSLSFLPSAAMADHTGAMILYPSAAGEGMLKRLEEKLTAEACVIWRKGNIGPARRGNISIGDNDRFALVDCEGNASAPEGISDILSEVITPKNGAIAFIGPFIRREAFFADDPSVKERRYILKISHMNNSDVRRFRHEYGSFMESSMQLKNAFHFEAAISAKVTLGMPRPDMVEVFYYDDLKTQRRFIDDNPGIMAFSRKFNADHMASFLYMRATPK